MYSPLLFQRPSELCRGLTGRSPSVDRYRLTPGQVQRDIPDVKTGWSQAGGDSPGARDLPPDGQESGEQGPENIERWRCEDLYADMLLMHSTF